MAVRKQTEERRAAAGTDKGKSPRKKGLTNDEPPADLSDDLDWQLSMVRQWREERKCKTQWPEWAQNIDRAATLVQREWRDKVKRRNFNMVCGDGGLLDGGPNGNPSMMGKNQWGWKLQWDPWATVLRELQILPPKSSPTPEPDANTATDTDTDQSEDEEPLAAEEHRPSHSKPQTSHTPQKEPSAQSLPPTSKPLNPVPSPPSSGGAGTPAGRKAATPPPELSSPRSCPPEKDTQECPPAQPASPPPPAPESGGFPVPPPELPIPTTSEPIPIPPRSPTPKESRFPTPREVEPKRTPQRQLQRREQPESPQPDPKPRIPPSLIPPSSPAPSPEVQPAEGEKSAMLPAFMPTSPQKKRRNKAAPSRQDPLKPPPKELTEARDCILGTRDVLYRFKDSYFKPKLPGRTLSTDSSLAFSVAQFSKWTTIMKLRLLELEANPSLLDSPGSSSSHQTVGVMAAQVSKLIHQLSDTELAAVFQKFEEMGKAGAPTNAVKQLVEEVELWLEGILEQINGLIRDWCGKGSIEGKLANELTGLFPQGGGGDGDGDGGNFQQPQQQTNSADAAQTAFSASSPGKKKRQTWANSDDIAQQPSHLFKRQSEPPVSNRGPLPLDQQRNLTKESSQAPSKQERTASNGGGSLQQGPKRTKNPSSRKRHGFTLAGETLPPRRSSTFTEGSCSNGAQTEKGNGTPLRAKIAGRQQQQQQQVCAPGKQRRKSAAAMLMGTNDQHQEKSSSQKLGDQLKLPPVPYRGPRIYRGTVTKGSSNTNTMVQDARSSSDSKLPPIPGLVGVGSNYSSPQNGIRRHDALIVDMMAIV